MEGDMNVRAELERDHLSIERQLEQLGVVVDANDFAAIQALMGDVDAQLRKHLDAEERCMLKRFGEENPQAAAAIREQHAALSKTVDQLCLAAELHTLRKDAVDEFITNLRDHMVREHADLYAWSEQHLQAPERRGLLSLLHGHASARSVDRHHRELR